MNFFLFLRVEGKIGNNFKGLSISYGDMQRVEPDICSILLFIIIIVIIIYYIGVNKNAIYTRSNNRLFCII